MMAKGLANKKICFFPRLLLQPVHDFFQGFSIDQRLIQPRQLDSGLRQIRTLADLRLLQRDGFTKTVLIFSQLRQLMQRLVRRGIAREHLQKMRLRFLPVLSAQK